MEPQLIKCLCLIGLCANTWNFFWSMTISWNNSIKYFLLYELTHRIDYKIFYFIFQSVFISSLRHVTWHRLDFNFKSRAHRSHRLEVGSPRSSCLRPTHSWNCRFLWWSLFCFYLARLQYSSMILLLSPIHNHPHSGIQWFILSPIDHIDLKWFFISCATQNLIVPTLKW